MDPILIAGAPRSGTSMVAGLFAAHGVQVGRFLRPTPQNEKGHFENEKLKALMKRVLFENGFETTPLPAGWPTHLTTSPSWDVRVEEAMDESCERRGGFAVGAPWLVKESRILMTLCLWRASYPAAVYVLPRRPVDDVVASMQRHPQVSKNGGEAELRRWVHLCYARQDEIRNSGLPHVPVDTKAIASGNLREATDMLLACGIEPDRDKIIRFVDRRLWHHGDPV